LTSTILININSSQLFFGVWRMATVIYGPSGTSVNDISPGDEESWVLWGFSWGDVVEVSAHPFSWREGKERTLTVSNLVSEAAPDGSRRIFFTVKNTGDSTLNYGVFTSWISP
jgi:hypothetical protein